MACIYRPGWSCPISVHLLDSSLNWRIWKQKQNKTQSVKKFHTILHLCIFFHRSHRWQPFAGSSEQLRDQHSPWENFTLHWTTLLKWQLFYNSMIMIMTVGMITMMNSNDLTNNFTWEACPMDCLTIDLLMRSKILWWITWHCHQNLQQQARPVWNREERWLDNSWIFLPAPHSWRRWSRRATV